MLQADGIFPPKIVEKFAEPLGDAIDYFEMYNDRLIACFVATFGHESNSFKVNRESLNYDVPGLLRNFSRARITEAEAKALGRSGSRPAAQEMIAEVLYGTRNGNRPDTGDAWKYRGAFIGQITGRGNFLICDHACYRHFKAHGISLVSRPEWGESPLISCLASVGFAASNPAFLKAAMEGDFMAASGIWNLGRAVKTPQSIIGWKDRLRRYQALSAWTK
jgi:predicted chitinase